eukprot:scaffold30_cov166-Ochromonas_danica.AAC.5
MKEGRPVRALLLDVTGTLLTFRCPMGVTYRNCAEAVGLTPLPKAEDLQSSFSSAFRQQWQRFPCYGAHHGVSEEAWWKETARQTLLSSLPLPSPPVKDRQMAHFLEEVYSFYGREEAYTLFEDATSLLDFAHRHGLKVVCQLHSRGDLLQTTQLSACSVGGRADQLFEADSGSIGAIWAA